jgi:hypothetical protein
MIGISAAQAACELVKDVRAAGNTCRAHYMPDEKVKTGTWRLLADNRKQPLTCDVLATTA